MDPQAAKMIGAGIATLALAGVGIGMGNIFGSFLAAAVRNPAAAPKVFGNVLLSSRGLFAVIIGAVLAHRGWHELEQRVDRATLLRRIAAAVLMTAAIALYVIDAA